MTRIAYVSADLGVPVFGTKGCSIHAQEVLGALSRRGSKIDLFTTSAEGERTHGLESVRVHPMARPPKGDHASREQFALAGNETLRSALQSVDPFDLVYERYSLWSFAGMEFARDNGLAGVLEVNAPLIEEQAEYRVLIDRASAERVAERVFAAATALLPVSEEVANYLERFPGTRGKIHIVRDGVRPERFPEGLKPALPAPASFFTVGFVGTLKAWHGVSILVEAFALLRARLPQTRLIIVGDGPERERIEADVMDRGLNDAVQLTGAVPPGEVPSMLASMDAVVAPYPNLPHFYFSPLKVFEYMAAGLPVVASRIGQLGKLISTEVKGLRVPPGNSP